MQLKDYSTKCLKMSNKRYIFKGVIIMPLSIFRPTLGKYEYDVKISPADNMLYLSVAQKHQVWRVESLEAQDVGDPRLNKIIFAGNGERCLPGDTKDRCGDDGVAINARLNYPKGSYFLWLKDMFES